MPYTRLAVRIFGSLTEILLPYLPEIRPDLKKARLKIAVQEYVSKGMLTSLIVFLFELPLLSFIFSIIFPSFFFAFITSFTVSFFLTIGFFFAFLYYPKLIVRDKAKKIDRSLTFASLYLATIMGSKLPLHQVLKIFSRFSKYDVMTKEIEGIINDMEAFGLDINTALERAIERTPSKEFKELLWGILSVNKAGGDMNEFLKEKSKSYIAEYRRKLYEFSHQLVMFIEVYLTLIVVGVIFFTILTSIMSGIAGIGADVVNLQFFLIFILLPVISLVFIVFVKGITPGGE